MERQWEFRIPAVLVAGVLELCHCLPIDLQSTTQGLVEWQWTTDLIALMLAACVIVVIAGCLCCQHRKGFEPDEGKTEKEFTNASVSASAGSLVGRGAGDLENAADSDPGLVNPITSLANASEFTIFRPLSPSHNNNILSNTVQSPTIRGLTAKRTTGADFEPCEDVNHWFDVAEVNFPRNKLKYVREIGRGWFGRVIAGEAASAHGDAALTDDVLVPVVVRVLEAAAGSRERAAFLRDARIYYHTSHPNILALHGRCLEVPPLLLIQEYCAKGDLRKYLREHATKIVDASLLLRLAWQLSSALQYLHQNNISHPDLALRNCQVSNEMSLLLGDYGISAQIYPEDYYQGTPPVPVRWCAPENVICTQSTIQPLPVSCAGNVWSLGVTLWEIITYGQQPYHALSDDDVVSLVLESHQTTLAEPASDLYYAHNVYQLSRLCCTSVSTRPPITQVHSMLTILLQSNDNSSTQPCDSVSDAEFQARWNGLKPNTIVKTDNHTPEHTNPLQIDVTSGSSEDRTMSVGTAVHYDATQLSPASTVNSDCFSTESKQVKSPSLTNLHGSLENLLKGEEQSHNETTSPHISKDNNPFTIEQSKPPEPSEEYESWLEKVASQNREDINYVKGISQAMKELDSALAFERSSSSSETSHQPSPGPESWTEQQKIAAQANKPPPHHEPSTPLNDHPKIDFRLGPIVPPSGNTLPETSSQPDSLIDSILFPRSTSGSETEDETWRKRIERGAYSEKVRMKSKSVADLMVLTHIDTDTDSETPLPSLDYKTKPSIKANLENINKCFGSEGNLDAVHDTFGEELRKLKEARRDSLLFVPMPQQSDGESQHIDDIEISSRDIETRETDTNIPCLNIIHASHEDLSTLSDLDIPLRVFLKYTDANVMPTKQQNVNEMDPFGNAKTPRTGLEEVMGHNNEDLLANFDLTNENNVSNLPLVNTTQRNEFQHSDNNTNDGNNCTNVDTTSNKEISNIQETEIVNTVSNNAELSIQNIPKGRTNLVSENLNIADLLNLEVSKEDTTSKISLISTQRNAFQYSAQTSDIEVDGNKSDITSIEDNMMINESAVAENLKCSTTPSSSENTIKNEVLIHLPENITKSLSGNNLNQGVQDTVENPTKNKILIDSTEHTTDTLTGNDLQPNVDDKLNNTNSTIVAEIVEVPCLNIIAASCEDLSQLEDEDLPISMFVKRTKPLVFRYKESEILPDVSEKSLTKSETDSSLSEFGKHENLPFDDCIPKETTQEVLTMNPSDITEDLSLKGNVGANDNTDLTAGDELITIDKALLDERGNIKDVVDDVSNELIQIDFAPKQGGSSQFNTHIESPVKQNLTFEKTSDVNLTFTGDTKIEPNVIKITEDFLTNELTQPQFSGLDSRALDLSAPLPPSKTHAVTSTPFKQRPPSGLNAPDLEALPEEPTSDSMHDLQNRTIDLVQTVSSLGDESAGKVPTHPQEFNVMRFEVIPNYNSGVILGPCDDYALDLYSGLKTTFGKLNELDLQEDELLQFSTNFTPLDMQVNDQTILPEPNYTSWNGYASDERPMESVALHRIPTSPNITAKDSLSSVTPCDSLEEHAMNTTYELKYQAETIVHGVISDAERIVTGQLEAFVPTRSDVLPVVVAVVDQIITEAEAIAAKNMNSVQSDRGPSDVISDAPQLDSLEYVGSSFTDNSTTSLNNTVIMRGADKTFDVPNGNETFDVNKTWNISNLNEDIDSSKTNATYVLSDEKSITNGWTNGGELFDSTYTANEDNSGFSLELGWFLHPPGIENGLKMPVAEGTIDDLESPPTSDNSYVGFSLDEECVAALRNELAAKLPHAQGPLVEPELQEDWDTEPGTSEQHDEIILRYNIFAAPLSPIAEESEEFECPTPDTTHCRDDSDSDCEWSGACCDGADTDTRTPRAGSPNAAGRRSSRHRHTPSMDSCCSNDTLFNIEDIIGPPPDHPAQHERADLKLETLISEHSDQLLHITLEAPTMSDDNPKTVKTLDSQEEKTPVEGMDTSDVYPSSTERCEAEPSTQEINSDYFSPTRDDLLSQLASELNSKISDQIAETNSLKANNKIRNNIITNDAETVNDSDCKGMNEIENPLNLIPDQDLTDVNISDGLSQNCLTYVLSNSPEPAEETYTMSDILNCLEDTPPIQTAAPFFSDPTENETKKDSFLDLTFVFTNQIPTSSVTNEVLTETAHHQVEPLKNIVADFLHREKIHGDFLGDIKTKQVQISDVIGDSSCQDLKYGSDPSSISPGLSGDGSEGKFEGDVESCSHETVPKTSTMTGIPVTNHLMENNYAQLENDSYTSVDDEFGTCQDPYVLEKADLYENINEVRNFYVNLDKSPVIVTDLDDYKKGYDPFDDASVMKFYENIPTSPVHDDKIIESIYENIGRVSDKENIERLFNLSNGIEAAATNKSPLSDTNPNTPNLYDNVSNGDVTYDKLYENLANCKDVISCEKPSSRTHKLSAQQHDSVENSASVTDENGAHDDDTYDKVYTVSDDLYSDITDIRFSGPCDAQLMSTSFSDPHGGSDDQDWDSGSDSRSSSSGEFVWKEGEHEAAVHVLRAPLDILGSNEDEHKLNATNQHRLEQDEETSSTSSGEDGEGMEFIPSAWDSQAAPQKSSLRSPDKTAAKCERKNRGVWFKKQKYHCVYEYPREPEFSPPEWTQPTGSGLWGTPTAADLSSFAEWELDTENVVEEGAGSLLVQDMDLEDDSSSRYVRRDYYRRPGDLYRLADVAPDIDFASDSTQQNATTCPFPRSSSTCSSDSQEVSNGASMTDDDFYITSSTRPFQSYSLGCQFFPGQLHYSSSDAPDGAKQDCANAERTISLLDFANDLKKLHSANVNCDKMKGDLTTPDSGMEDITPASMSDQSDFAEPESLPAALPTVSSLKLLASNVLKGSKSERESVKVQDVVMGGLRHTRDRLKLDLPPSPSSFSANKAFNLDISGADSSGAPASHRERELPTFTTFGKTRFSIKHVDTPTDELDVLALPPVLCKVKTPPIVETNSSSTESTSNDTNSPDAMDFSQPSECDSSSVGECLLDAVKRRSIEVVRGEASLLDSADEDSGIESSANATLEREAAVVVVCDHQNKA